MAREERLCHLVEKPGFFQDLHRLSFQLPVDAFSKGRISAGILELEHESLHEFKGTLLLQDRAHSTQSCGHALPLLPTVKELVFDS